MNRQNIRVTQTMHRKRFFVFLAIAPAVWSAGQCDANGVCTVKGGIKNGKWWRKELNNVQPECLKIDPENTGTCHQWTANLNPQAAKVTKNIKQMVADFIYTTEKVGAKRRTLKWNDPMDELYLSAPKNSEGSDRVFVTPHIDGFVGWIPFMRQWRCVYGLTGPHDTVTVQPMRNPAERAVELGPGVFTCFDFNREIHWIETREGGRANVTRTTLDERMVLKLHFYEYPTVLGDWLGDLFGGLNAQYNFAARRAFLVSQFPDRSLVSRLVARAINGITILGGSLEEVFGYANLGIVGALAAAVGFRPEALLPVAGVLPLLALLLATTFRSATLGMLTRDATALGGAAAATVLASLARANAAYDGAKTGGGGGGGGAAAEVLALPTYLVLGGLALVVSAARALGPDRAFYGAQLAPQELEEPLALQGPTAATAFPYSVAAHPMALGALAVLAGLRLHPVLSPRSGGGLSKPTTTTTSTALAWGLAVQAALVVALVVAEAWDLHVPPHLAYFEAFNDFAACHTVKANVFLHLVTTLAALAGVLGLVVAAASVAAGKEQGGGGGSKPASAATASPAATGGLCSAQALPLVVFALTWLISRYTVPDDDVAFCMVGLMGLLGVAVRVGCGATNKGCGGGGGPLASRAACLGLVALGVVGQELCHAVYGEGTYMASYADGSVPLAEAAATLALHNVWLLPFELRAAINAATPHAHGVAAAAL